MEPLEVYANKGGQITIKQVGTMQDDDQHVAIHPSQVEIVCAWLREVREEIAADAAHDHG